MRWMTWTVAALVAVPALTAQQFEVSLDEAVRRALEVQPAIVQARGDQRNAAVGRRQAFGAFLPTANVSWNANRQQTYDTIIRIDPVTGRPLVPKYTSTAGLTLNLELFDGLRRFNTVRASAASQDAADAGYVGQRYQVILLAKQAFYAALATEALVGVAEAQLRRAEQQLQISVEKLRAGSATRSDSLRSAVEYGNAQLDLLSARADLATAQANLGRQVGVDAPVRAVRASTDLPAFPDTSALRSEVTATAPVVVQAEAEARAARAQAWAARSQYMPTFTVRYSDSHQAQRQQPLFAVADNAIESVSWQFAVQWTLFNGFTRETQQVAAAVQRDNAEARAEDARRQVHAQLTQQLATLTNSFIAIDIARSNVAAATEDLRVQQERYRVGASTILDLLASQAQLTTAQTNLVQTQFDYAVARAQLEALMGRPL